MLLSSVAIMMVRNIHEEKHLRLIDDRDILARIVAEAVSSERTFLNPCKDNPPKEMQRIAVLKANGDTLISANGTVFGDWTLVGFCSNGGLEIKAAKLRAGVGLFSEYARDFVTDPMTGRPLWWFDPRSYLIPPRTPSEKPEEWRPGEKSSGGYLGSVDGKPAMRELHPANANTYFCLPRVNVGGMLSATTATVPFVAKAGVSALNAYAGPSSQTGCTAGAEGIVFKNGSSVLSGSTVNIPATCQQWPMSYLVLGE
jgi:hypothetical protein